ncbi:MAG TPA: hypothetical protein VLZ81_08550 [Blastocatellia bacterium]|nr:hypothetical protein [Blastocatellia bacterium]
MGTTGKSGLTRPKQKPATGQIQSNVTPLRDDVGAATRAYVKQSAYQKAPYLKMAVVNPYNISLFFGGLIAAALTVSPFLAVTVIGLEILWIVFGPESKLLQKLIWDPRLEKERAVQAQIEYSQRVANLSDPERRRVEGLVSREAEINRLAGQNPSFTGELLRTELGKTDRLVDSFIDMAVTCARYEQYLGGIDLGDLERDRRKWDAITKATGRDDAEIQIAKKNLAIVMKRFDKVKEIQRYLTIARGQLDLIENSFQLISDQIVTMQSPQELSGQLDELLDGVESIKETAIDTEKLLSPV